MCRSKSELSVLQEFRIAAKAINPEANCCKVWGDSREWLDGTQWVMNYLFAAPTIAIAGDA